MPAPASSAHAAPRSSQPPAGRPFVLRLAVPPGTPRHHTPLTPVSFLLRAALVAPDARAIVHPQRRYGFTYAQWAARCLSLAFALRATPAFEPGTVVAVVAPNCPMILEAHHAVLAAAGIVQPINIRNSPAEISYVLEHSGARVVLVDSEFAALIEPKHAQRGTTVVVSHDSGGVLADDHHDPYEQFLDAGWQAWQRANRTSSASGRSPTLDWAHFSLPRSEDTPSSLCYTSGTTGRPKGVLTTVRGSYLAALANAFEMRLTHQSVYLWILPAFHCSGWTYPWATTAAMACSYTLRKVDYALIWEAFLRGGVTHTCGAPTVQVGVVSHPNAQNVCTSTRPSIRVGVAGSAPTAALLGRLQQLGFEPVHIYGMTETYGPFTRRYDQDGGVGEAWAALNLDARARLMAQQGHGFLTADEVRVFRVPAGFDGDWGVVSGPAEDVAMDGTEVGEVAMRGNIVMRGYFADAAATRKATFDGYLMSGDLAVRLPGGAIHIRDRSKDIIIPGGENVSSLMVEQELSAHPLVRECAIVARPHPRWGEAGHATVVLTPEGLRHYLTVLLPTQDADPSTAVPAAAGTAPPASTAAAPPKVMRPADVPDADADSHDAALGAACAALNAHQHMRMLLTRELRSWCRARMSHFAVPAWVELAPALPKVPTGKVQKALLRARVAALPDEYPVPLATSSSITEQSQPLASKESGFVPAAYNGSGPVPSSALVPTPFSTGTGSPSTAFAHTTLAAPNTPASHDSDPKSKL